MFKRRNIVSAIDIGTSKICVLVGCCENDEPLSVIGRGERDVATGVRAVSGLLPAGLEGAAHIVHAGEHKGDETYRHTSPSSVHRQSTGRSQSWEGSASTTWRAVSTLEG